MLGALNNCIILLKHLIEDDNLAIKIGQNAILTVKEKYSKTSIAQSYINLFSKSSI